MIKFKYGIFFALFLILNSCLDMLEKSPKVFIGKIYLKESSEFKSPYLIYGEHYDKDGTFDYLIRETIKEAKGNDSIIYVKSNYETENKYYLIRHDYGEKILKIDTIDSLRYTKFLLGNEFKYSYLSK